ncbi:MAG: hypothetical protein LBH12_02535, partial [Dysgonamonadaceae bacterium]|nr:hypothetical protein [Dysgonamonadaceae bacterium]
YYYPDQTFRIYRVKDDEDLELLLQQNDSLLSDFLSPVALSRASILKSNIRNSSYRTEIKDSIPYDLGVLVIAKIKK